MSVNAPGMADEIRSAMGFPTPVTAQLVGWSQGVLDELTISGSAATGSPSGNAISGLTGASMAARIQSGAGYPSVSTELLAYATALSNYINGNAVVAYTNPPTNDSGGTISGMTGAAMAVAVAAGVGFPSVSSELLAKCTAIVDHIQSNALVNGGIIA